MGTNAFSPQRAESFRHFLLLPSPSVVYHGRKPANLRVGLGARAVQFQASGLWLRSHAGACSPPAQRTTTGRAGPPFAPPSSGCPTLRGFRRVGIRNFGGEALAERSLDSGSGN